MPELSQLIELLEKVGKTTAHVRVEIDYDGREWYWKMPQSNITASEWTPRQLREKREGTNRT